MRTLVFLLEELSAKDLLKGFLPQVLSKEILVRYLVFEGKQDLEKQISRKLRAWLEPNSVFIVLRDQDAAACEAVKEKLVSLVKESGRDNVMVRVACHELESWVLGDFDALAKAYENPKLKKMAQKASYRQPDQLHNPIDEIRKFVPEYQKRSGARKVGPYLNPDRNQSTSFRFFVAAVRKLADASVE